MIPLLIPQRMQKLSALLRVSPDYAHLTVLADRPQSALDATQLDVIFTQSGWHTTLEVIRPIGIDLNGIYIFIKSPSSSSHKIISAFRDLDINLKILQTFPYNNVTGSLSAAGAIQIIVATH